MIALFSKYLIPLTAIISFVGGSFFGVKVLDKKCPDCKPQLSCPIPEKCPPCNGIDFDKIKSKALTIQNQQYLTINGDSILIDRLRDIMREELQKTKISRCK